MAIRLRAEGGGYLDEQEARRALALYLRPGHACQIQALPSGRFAILPEGDPEQALEVARGFSDESVYLILNPLHPGLETGGGASGGAVVADVAERRWFYLDADPTKPEEFKDDSATEEEHARTLDLLKEVVVRLAVLGWPAPVVVDSGNGHYGQYRIDLPNDNVSRALLSSFIKALRRAFPDGPSGKIDPKMINANRLAKLPGCLARKGRRLPDRPHRPCRILDIPDPLGVVTAEQIRQATEALGGPPADSVPWSPPAAAPAPVRSGGLRLLATSGAHSYVQRVFQEEVAALAACPAGGRNDRLNWCAFRLGQFVGGGCLLQSTAEAALREAARECGLYDDTGCGECGVEATIASGLEAGKADPKRPPEPPPTAPPACTVVPEGERLTYAASEVTPRRVEWLWRHRIPLGKLTTYAGVGGLGKTFALCDLSARVSRGLDWPECGAGRAEVGDVLFVSGEDEPDDTLVPRLIELGADLRRVHFMRTEVQDAFTLADLKTLEKVADEIGQGLRLVCIDPPTAYLAGVDDHKNAELRGLLSPLKSWVARRRCAMVFNTHLTKGGGVKMEAMMRVMGSVAWVNAVRAAHLFCVDPDKPEQNLFCPLKSNLGPKKKPLAYRIVVRPEDMATIQWLGEVDTTADAALNHTPRQRRHVTAGQWLIERFRERREWRSDELLERARQDGVSRNALFEAKTTLSLPRARLTVESDGSRVYVWWVPDNWQPLFRPAVGPPEGPEDG